MQGYFLKLFRYNEWANQNTLKAVAKAGSRPQTVLDYLSHILAAQDIWLGRVLNSGSRHDSIWPQYAFEEIQEKLPESSEEWTAFIETMNDDHFQEEHQYTNSKGKLFKTTLEDVILHVVNHSTHHRAQISRILREQGDEPPLTDYIFYTREQKSA